MARAENFREEITQKIITALENGTVPWQQPWDGREAYQNAVTKRQYSGINCMILSMASREFETGKTDPRWMTYKQAQEAGYQVRKGSKGTHVLLWKPELAMDKNGKTEITAVLQKIFTVFHASQVDGIKEYEPPEVNVIEAHEKADRIVRDSGAKIVYGGGEAYYSPARNYIQLPPKEDFKSTEGYYSTMLHELVHWTGHESRLNRVQRCGKFSSDYAFEELIAEMGSLFVASSAGIPQSETEFQNHASYIESWLKHLKRDSMYIFKAAAEANKAANYLLKTENNCPAMNNGKDNEQ